MTIVLSLRYMTVVTVTLLLSILLLTFTEALTLRHPTKLFSSRSTRICTTTLHLKKKEGINKEFDNENKKSEYVNSVVGIDRGAYLLLIPAIISKFKIKSQIQFIAIFLLTQYTNDRCFHFFSYDFELFFLFFVELTYGFLRYLQNLDEVAFVVPKRLQIFQRNA